MIGIFDSGVGGLSVWREIQKLMPEQDLLYFADSKYCPYGNKDLSFIIERAEFITKFLIEKGAEVVVVACNTATTAAIKILREKFEIDFVGIEPATNLAAKLTRSNTIGVLATENTLKSGAYKLTLEKISPEIRLVERAGIGLVELVEAGKIEGEEVIPYLKPHLEYMLEEGVDTLVLGCTHYPFLEPAIREIVGESLQIIDPSIYVAARTQYILNLKERKQSKSKNLFYTNGELDVVRTLVRLSLPKASDSCFHQLL